MTDQGYWNPEEYDGKAQERYEAGEYEAALEILREGTERFPGAVELHVSLGFTQMAREDFVAARRAFTAALRIETDHEDALAGVGEAYLKLGERARGLAAFERVLEMGFSRDADLMLSIGRALVREDLLEAAERFLRLAVDAGDSGRAALGDLAYVRQRRGAAEEARVLLESALVQNPANYDVRAMLAHDLYEMGDRRAALAHYRKIPPPSMWDSLTIWRTVDLLRAFHGMSDEDAELRPYLERLDQIFDDTSPEDRLLEEVAAGVDGPEPASEASPGVAVGQFDMFRPGAESARRDPSPYRPDWRGVVNVLCRMSANPDRTVEQFMEDTARRVRSSMGLALPTDDPGAFLEASVRAGVLRLDERGAVP